MTNLEKNLAKKRDRELVCNMKYRNTPMLEFTMAEIRIFSRMFIEINKRIYHSKRTKSFMQRRFKNKHRKKFKHKILEKSKYQMINTLSDWAEEERNKVICGWNV